MKIKSIELEFELETIKDIEDSNLNAYVTLEDDRRYTVLVVTYKNILTLMNNYESDFLLPIEPIIIVKKLTMEIIKQAIEAYAEDDAYMLKLYHIATSIYPKTLNILINKWFERQKS